MFHKRSVHLFIYFSYSLTFLLQVTILKADRLCGWFADIFQRLTFRSFKIFIQLHKSLNNLMNNTYINKLKQIIMHVQTFQISPVRCAVRDGRRWFYLPARSTGIHRLWERTCSYIWPPIILAKPRAKPGGATTSAVGLW